MSTEVRVPTLPESVADATITTWYKQPGETVKRDEKLLDLETDKVVLEVPAPADGVLGAHRFAAGDTVTASDLLTTIEEGSATAPAESQAEPKAETTTSSESTGPTLTPAVRRLIKENDLNPSAIKGTGKDGRILKTDVLSYLESQKQPAAAPIAETLTSAPQAALASTGTATGDRPEQRVPMTRLRARIAERLLQAQSQAAILTTFNEVNLQAVMDLRKRHQEKFEKAHGVRLGLMSFFVKAATEALKKFPAVNASVDGNDIVYHGYFDIGIAVGSSRGLVVPVLRNTDQLGFADIEKAIREYGQKAEAGTLNLEELTGGTFTISNGGIYGSMLSTPILNPPQSAILGMHNIQQRPVAENGEVVIRPMMYLALSYDHRIIDGREAVQFLLNIKENLEDPARLMLEL